MIDGKIYATGFFMAAALGFVLGIAAASLKPPPQRVWLDKPHTIADIDNVRCYYWHNPHPYTGNKTLKACEIHKR